MYRSECPYDPFFKVHKQHCIPLELPHTILHPQKDLHIRGLHLNLANVFQYIQV